MYHHLYTIYEEEEICNKDRLDIILEKLEKIEEKLSILEKKTDTNAENCEKMSSHIDFIESVYNRLKSPIEYVTWKFGFSSSRQLPST